MKEQLTRPREHFKRFRLEVDPLTLSLSIKGPLGVFNYPKVQHKLIFHPHLNESKLVWFDYSKQFLNWIPIAQRNVSVGYLMELTLNGVAFKGNYMPYSHGINLDLGYSHNICFLLPDEANVVFEKRKLTVLSPDPVWLTTTAYRLKKLRWPDAYRGKGVIYKDEKLRLRPGKQRQ